MTLLWVSQWFGIANVSRKLKPRVIKSFTERFLKKLLKMALCRTGKHLMSCILRWLDPLEMPKFAYAGTEYHDTSKMLSNDTICDFLFKWEPFEGRD